MNVDMQQQDDITWIRCAVMESRALSRDLFTLDQAGASGSIAGHRWITGTAVIDARDVEGDRCEASRRTAGRGEGCP